MLGNTIIISESLSFALMREHTLLLISRNGKIVEYGVDLVELQMLASSLSRLSGDGGGWEWK